MGLSNGYASAECALASGDGIGISLRGVVGDETTFASKADALVGLLDVPESLREVIGTSVVRHGEETVDGVNGGRRLPDRDRAGASVGSE